jgi:glutathione peroxidase
MSAFYTLKATKKTDDIFDFAELKGKTVLIVNTASQW